MFVQHVCIVVTSHVLSGESATTICRDVHHAIDIVLLLL